MTTQHPFGGLLAEFRTRKLGLSQNRLAELAGYSPSVLVRMCQGKKDLTGPSGRERIVRIVDTLCDEGVRLTVDEANALFAAANLPPLYDGLLSEANLIRRLRSHSTGGVSLPAQRTNLLPPITSFIGREADVANLAEGLAKARLITLTGAGGVGKSRLAIEVTARLMTTFRDGVWIVELAAVSESKHVIQRFAQTLGASAADEDSEQDIALRTLQHRLQAKNMLIVLDNCEHVLEACAHLVENLLPICPNLRILATSREALHTPGELVWHVPSLTSPNITPLKPSHLLEYEAAQLFVERASHWKHQFELNANNTAAVATICKRLDGIPLALELVAALVEGMSVQEIAKLLDSRLALKVEANHRSIPRQRTMRESLDWSFALLTPPQQRLLAYFSVFTGGWTIDAAKAIGVTDPLDTDDVAELLLQLVRKSLVVAEPRDLGTRYRLLEPVRQYAAEKLVHMGELQVARDCHLMYFVTFTEQLKDHKGQGEFDISSLWIKQIVADYDNILAALTWGRNHHKDCALELRLVTALYRFWLIYAKLREGYARISLAFERCNPAPSHVKAHALVAMATLCRYLRNYRKMSSLAEEGLALCRRLKDQEGIAVCLSLLAVRADVAFDYEQAVSLRREATHIFESIESILKGSDLDLDTAWTLIDRGDYVIAAVMLNKFGTVARRFRDLQGAWIELWELATIALRCGDSAQAISYLEQTLVIAHEYGMGEFIARSLEHWSLADQLSALTLGERELQQQREIGDSRGVADLLLAVGRINLDSGHLDRAHVLLTECVATWDALGPLGSEWGGPAWACLELGHIARQRGNFPMAIAHYEESYRRHKIASSMDGIPTAHLHLGYTLFLLQDMQGATRKFLESLQHYCEAGMRQGISLSLGGLAEIKHIVGRSANAARLAGAARALLRDDELRTMRPIELAHANRIASSSEQWRIEGVSQAWNEGRQMTIQQAIELGLVQGQSG